MKGRFLASLGFAAVAALAIVPFLLAAAPLVGFGASLGVFSVLATAAYLFVIAPDPSRGLRAAALAGAALGVAWLLLPTRPAQLLALLVVIAVPRSVFFYRRRPARALAVELALGLASMLAAGLLSGQAVLAWAMAAWGVGLAQSLYFLLADLEVRDGESRPDAFESAHERAMRLLELTGH